MTRKNLQNITNKTISIIMITIVIFGFLQALIRNSYAISQTRNIDSQNIYNINETLYPGYASALQSLKESHPNWTFTLLYTDLEWTDVLINETVASHTRSLVQGKTGEWLCTHTSCAGIPHDGSNWYGASQTAVAYYMDPRNFLTESKIFQFEALSYIPSIHTESGVEAVLKGTFMSNKKISEYYNNSSYSDKTFAQVIMEAAKESGVSPYHIAARIRQEVGVNGSGSTSGKVSGYEGYYNFYNIGAYASSDAVINGLIYAKSSSINWDTPEKSIMGGAKWIATSYISKGQDSIYLEKWDVDNQYLGIYSHQYMQNIQAAASESSSVYSTYSSIFNNNLKDTSFNFIIPMYKNIPKTVSRYPSSSTYVSQDAQIRDTSGIGVYIRETPAGKVKDIYYNGTSFLRIELNASTVSGNNWDKVMLSDGSIGYIATQYVTEKLSNDLLSKKAYINEGTDLLNGPRITSNGTTAFRTLYEGQSVTILEDGKYKFDGVTWVRIKLGDGTTGYIPKDYVTEGIYGEEVEITCDTELALRSEPSGNLTMYIYPGVIVNRLEKATDKINGYYWDKVITSDGIVGYMARERYNPYALWLTPVNGENNTNVDTGSDNNEDKNNESENKSEENNNTDNENTEVDYKDEKMQIDSTEKEIKLVPQTTFDDIKAKYEDATIVSGTEKLGTGTVIKIGNIEFTVIKYGDVNGDSDVDIIDWALIKRHILGTNNLVNEYKKAGLLQANTQEIDIIDWALLKRHILSTQIISMH